MNPYPSLRFFRTTRHCLFTLLVAVGLMVGLVPATLAQADPGIVLTTQFFGSITGEPQLYRISPATVLHAPSRDYVGRAGLAEFRQDLAASFTNVTFSTQNAAQAGDLVIVSFTMTGINTGSYQGLTSNCAGISVPGVAMLRVSEEHIIDETRFREPTVIAVQTVAEQWISYDSDLIASQIASYNLHYSSSSPGCAAYDLPQQDAPQSVYEPAPSCNAATDCRLPY